MPSECTWDLRSSFRACSPRGSQRAKSRGMKVGATPTRLEHSTPSSVTPVKGAVALGTAPDWLV